MSYTIKYVRRGANDPITEDVPGGKTMFWLYNKPLGKFSLWLLIKRKFFSWLGGRYMDSSKSQKRIAPFVKQHGIDLSEYHVPENGFKTFNDFFYRKVKQDHRPIGKDVISPADGRVVVFNDISHRTKFYVKGTEFSLAKFLNDPTLAGRFEGGAMMVVRLAPVDYHRYHFPVSGMVSENHKINGAYYSVSPIALGGKLKIFLENKREYSLIESKEYGTVAYVDVGATLTGSIIQTHQPNSEVKKGDEKGYFAFGGSTIVLLFEANKITFDYDIVSNTNNGIETWVKMGETVARSINS